MLRCMVLPSCDFFPLHSPLLSLYRLQGLQLIQGLSGALVQGRANLTDAAVFLNAKA